MKKAIVILLLLSLISLWPFFKSGYFKSHDGEWMVIRYTAFHQTLASGQIPVRFVDRLNNNYGYPVLNFLYPLPFYFSQIPDAAGFGPVDSIKFSFVVSTLLSLAFMFWALRQNFGTIASLCGALVYLYTPYRFVDLYVRGSIGENFAFVFVPLVLGSIFKVSKGQRKYFPILSISIALLALSHNVIALLFLPLLLLLGVIILKKDIKKVVLFFILGVLISTFFWLPALFDLQYVRLAQLKVSEIGSHLVNPSKLLITSWGFGPDPNASDGMSIHFGIVSIAVYFLFLMLVLFRKKFEWLPFVFVVFYPTIFFLLTKYSYLFWQIPGFDIIQFPWRLLSLIVFFTAFMTAYVVNNFKKPLLLAFFLISASIISTANYWKPEEFTTLPDSYYQTNEDTTTVREEYMPLWVKEKKASRADEKIKIDALGSVTPIYIKAANYRAQIDVTGDQGSVTVNTIYFPGWEVSVGGENIPINYSNAAGLMTFKLPKGKHDVIIKYNKTPVHKLSEIASIAALFTAGFFFYIWRKRNS